MTANISCFLQPVDQEKLTAPMSHFDSLAEAPIPTVAVQGVDVNLVFRPSSSRRQLSKSERLQPRRLVQSAGTSFRRCFLPLVSTVAMPHARVGLVDRAAKLFDEGL